MFLRMRGLLLFALLFSVFSDQVVAQDFLYGGTSEETLHDPSGIFKDGDIREALGVFGIRYPSFNSVTRKDKTVTIKIERSLLVQFNLTMTRGDRKNFAEPAEPKLLADLRNATLKTSFKTKERDAAIKHLNQLLKEHVPGHTVHCEGPPKKDFFFFVLEGESLYEALRSLAHEEKRFIKINCKRLELVE